jgi:hypothetical protein
MLALLWSVVAVELALIALQLKRVAQTRSTTR